jgi:purine-binding chemotaxis protein CheW
MSHVNEPKIANQTMLAFKVGKEEYAIRSVRAEGLCGYERVMPISGKSDFLIGVMQVGSVMAPVIDLRVQFDAIKPTSVAGMNVLILNINGRIIGIGIEHFSGVVRIADNQIRAPSPNMNRHDADFLLGIGHVDKREIRLLDIDRIMTLINAVFLIEKNAA